VARVGQTRLQMQLKSTSTLVAAILGAAVATAGCGSSTPPPLLIGAVDDAAKWAADPGRTMREAHASGFDVVVLSATWSRGAAADHDLPPVRRAVRAAVAQHVQPVLAVYQLSSSTPNSAADRAAFAAYAAGLARALPAVREVIVGNEPNLNLFWEPQFGPDGGDVAAASYEQLLAASYDALKSLPSPPEVIGGGLAPRGGDDATASRQTHSPTAFIRELGAAYRASGRSRPLMDQFSIHVYGENARIPPTLAHPRTTSIGIADYSKLVGLLGEAFDGTKQAGSKLPIVYGEYGVETSVPPDKASLYTGRESVPTATAATQADFYRQAIELTRRQPTVRMLVFFHLDDETRLEGLQTGVRYADGTPKPSLEVVRTTPRGR
jgi:hypothetical protein